MHLLSVFLYGCNYCSLVLSVKLDDSVLFCHRHWLRLENYVIRGAFAISSEHENVFIVVHADYCMMSSASDINSLSIFYLNDFISVFKHDSLETKSFLNILTKSKKTSALVLTD